MGLCVACNADVEDMEAHAAEMHPVVADAPEVAPEAPVEAAPEVAPEAAPETAPEAAAE